MSSRVMVLLQYPHSIPHHPPREAGGTGIGDVGHFFFLPGGGTPKSLQILAAIQSSISVWREMDEVRKLFGFQKIECLEPSRNSSHPH